MSISDYIDYQRAWITVGKYCRSSSDMPDKKTLEALSIIAKYEQAQKDNRITRILKNSKKTA